MTDLCTKVAGTLQDVETSQPQVASTTLDADFAKEAVSGVNRQDAEAAKVERRRICRACERDPREC